MKVMFDIDGCLANFAQAYETLVVEKAGGENLFPPNTLPPVWDWPQHYGYSDEVVAEAWKEIKLSQTFWRYLQPLEGMGHARCVNPFIHDVYYITDRTGKYAKQQTEDWLAIQGARRPTVLIAADKAPIVQALKLDCVIDDKLEHAVAVNLNCPTTRVYLLDRPYNQGECYGAKRIGSVREFIEKEGLI
jgi:hypothetical protein